MPMISCPQAFICFIFVSPRRRRDVDARSRAMDGERRLVDWPSAPAMDGKHSRRFGGGRGYRLHRCEGSYLSSAVQDSAPTWRARSAEWYCKLPISPQQERLQRVLLQMGNWNALLDEVPFFCDTQLSIRILILVNLELSTNPILTLTNLELSASPNFE